jgi:UDP-3-O-[3-hydroxymyristoyl] glucosamine N-acyltransferase
MGKHGFFDRSSGLTVAQIVALTGVEIRDSSRSEHLIKDVAPLELAGPADLTFIESNKYADDLASTKAGACLMPERFEGRAPEHLVVLRTKEPYRAFVAVHSALYPDALRPASLFEGNDVSPDATVHPTARLEGEVIVDPGAVIGPRAEIGSGTIIGANAVIGPDVSIGRDSVIGTGCSIMHALIGDRVVIHPGCRIGQDGFGFIPGAKPVKVPQTGRVIIQHDVEIGAATTIDRGGIRDTVIGEGSKIDNQCQIGHNVVLGRYCIVVAQCGLSGSVTLDDYAALGGSVGLAPHVKIGKGAQVAARSGVMHDIPPGEIWGGYPATPRKQWMRMQATLARLATPGAKSSDAKTPDVKASEAKPSDGS